MHVTCGRGLVLLWWRVVIRYVLVVLWMTSCFHIVRPMAHHVWREHNSRNCLINSSLYGLHTVSSLCSFCSTSHFIQRHSYSICNYQLFECFFWCWLTRVVPDKIQTALTIVCVSVCTCLFCLVRHNKTLARHHLVTSVIILEHRRKNVGFVHIRCRSDG